MRVVRVFWLVFDGFVGLGFVVELMSEFDMGCCMVKEGFVVGSVV